LKPFGLADLYPPQEAYDMAELTMMLFNKSPENNIRCRVINGWFKMDSYVSAKENLFSEIE
jgi:hypothetical protein